MKSNPPNHQIIQTEDGSLTLFSEKYLENCHSNFGARAETLLHYVEGCEIVKVKEKNGFVTILEVGFGLGVGFMTTLEILKDHFTFFSLEIDRDLVEWFRNQNIEHPILKNLIWVNDSLS